MGEDLSALPFSKMEKTSKTFDEEHTKVARPEAVFLERCLGLGLHSLCRWAAVAAFEWLKEKTYGIQQVRRPVQASNFSLW